MALLVARGRTPNVSLTGSPFLADRFRLASAASNDCLWEWDVTTGEISRSDAMATRFGYSSDEVLPTPMWWRDRMHAEDRDHACRSLDSAIAAPEKRSWTCEYRFRRRDGTYAEVCDRAFIVRNDAGRAVRVAGAVMDLSEVKDAYRALQKIEERYRCTIEVTGQIAWSASADGQRVEFDESWSLLTGLDCLMSPADWDQVAHPDDLSSALEHWRTSVETGKPLQFEQRLKVHDGSYRWFRTRAAAQRRTGGQVERWYGVIEDFHELKLSQDALKRVAEFDELTSLKNRRSFSVDLETALGRAGDLRNEVGLLVLDIDEFKSVNDLFGHDAGDLLLINFAQRMLDVGIELYRIGGDEFAAIVPTCRERNSLLSAAGRIHQALEEPFRVGTTVLECRTSIGCAVYPLHGENAGELLKSADIALYSAKAAGRGQTSLFSSPMRGDLQRRNSMLEVARRALKDNAVDAFLQPKVCLTTGFIVGFEALMRIRNERFGPQGPAAIRAAFAHPELALEIGDRILSKVVAAITRWRSQGLNFGRIAINASPLEFREENYAKWLLARLESARVSPRHIEVEVTETVFLSKEGGSILRCLEQLKRAGVTIALDDFGTGYASLSHLRQYPVDVIKIDRSFIRNITEDSREEMITRAIINLSDTLGIQTVAEGVETSLQADLLASFGCNIGQGFLFDRALTIAEAETLLRNRQRPYRAKPGRERLNGLSIAAAR